MNTTRQKLTKIPNVAGLYRHDSGTYYMIRKIKGKIKTASLETTDRKLAERKLKEKTEDQQNRTGEISLSDLSVKFLETKAGCKPGTIGVFRWAIGALRKDEGLFKKLVHEIPPSELAAFFGRQKLCPRTHNYLTQYVSQIFDLAIADGYITKNPVDEIPKLRKKVPKKKDNIPTFEEFEGIVEHIRTRPFSDTAELTANFISFYGRAAIGEAEATLLDWIDFEWEKERIKFKRVKTSGEFYVPFFPWLKPLVLELWEKAGKPKRGIVFPMKPNKKGIVLPIKSAKQAIMNACNRLDIEPAYSPRSFRKMGIVRQINAGLPIKLVAKYQGHTDGGKLILDTYSEVISSGDDEHEKKMIAALKG